MHSIRCLASLTALLPAADLLAQSPSYLVVPSAYATNDAISYERIAGASRELRQQTLIGASHLTSLVGRTLTAIELRRTAANQTYQGGTANLTVRMSISPNSTLACSSTFSANAGTPDVTVFSGTVVLPTSPPTAPPATGPVVTWSTNNIVRIPLQTPFVYTGGTLCIDVLGQPNAGQNANWWMADAEFEDIQGTVTDLGGGCGSYGGTNHQWSAVAQRTLLPGGYAHFFAYGTPWGLGLAAFGTKSPVGVPLSLLGFNAASGCDVFLSTLDAVVADVFVPDATTPSEGGRADVLLKVPGTPAMLALTMTTQWIDWMQVATSNAIEWTTAASIPTLDMALVEGHPTEATGVVSVHLAHVLRFEYQ
ncbi:MAG: hypothetical protein ABIP94_02790 [Planctomycetota bacterium]